MAFSTLAANQMVSEAEAATGGFALQSGQSHGTSNLMMTKSAATTKYNLDANALSGYASNQLIPKSAWISGFVGYSLQLIEVNSYEDANYVPWSNVCDCTWINPVTKYTKAGLTARPITPYPADITPYSIYNDIGCTSILQIAGKSYKALENGVFKRVAADSHSDMIAVIENCNPADTTAPNAPVISSSLVNSTPRINLTWTVPFDNVGVTGYELWKNNGGGWFLLTATLGTAYADFAVDYDIMYSYQVRAKDAKSNWSAFSGITSKKPKEPIFCFVEGTLIALPDGVQIPIESLELNQVLLSAAIETLQDTNDVSKLYKWKSNFLNENRISSPITKIEPKIVYETIIINGGLLEATPSHSQLIQRDGVWKFIPLGDVIVGDNLYGINKDIITITSVFVSLKKRTVYPMALSPSHTYFANGILTHNIKPAQ
jgi:hypothetical protein